MSRRLIFHPEAKAELNQSIELYEGRRPGTGQELRAHAREIFYQINQQPNRFPKANRRTRVATNIKFGFDIYYRELPDGNVKIISVYHHAHRPGGWKYRR